MHCRRVSIHATASACLRRWYSESRHRRVAAAAWREALWSALLHAIAVWREHADVLLAASKIDDTLSISAGSLRALAFRRWRSWTCSWRMLHLAQVAHSHMSRKVSFGRWSAFCTHPRSRRVQLRRPGSRNGSTFVSAFHAVAEQHRRQRAFLAALNAWRLTAVRRQLATADRVGIWRPVARRALYPWRVEANGCAWRERAAVQCATSSAFLCLALAMRMWHELAAQQPQVLKRLREERVSLTVTVLSFDRWRRHVDLLLSVTSSGRQQRRALRMPTTAAAAVRAAVVLAQQRAFRMWQLIRYDGPLPRTCAHTLDRRAAGSRSCSLEGAHSRVGDAHADDGARLDDGGGGRSSTCAAGLACCRAASHASLLCHCYVWARVSS